MKRILMIQYSLQGFQFQKRGEMTKKIIKVLWKFKSCHNSWLGSLNEFQTFFQYHQVAWSVNLHSLPGSIQPWKSMRQHIIWNGFCTLFISGCASSWKKSNWVAYTASPEAICPHTDQNTLGLKIATSYLRPVIPRLVNSLRGPNGKLPTFLAYFQ